LEHGVVTTVANAIETDGIDKHKLKLHTAWLNY